jgi:hypothetical protein
LTSRPGARVDVLAGVHDALGFAVLAVFELVPAAYVKTTY